MKLGEFENSRVFHAPKGNTKYVRDVVVTQVTKTIPKEPKIEEATFIKSPKPKRTRAKKNKNEKS